MPQEDSLNSVNLANLVEEDINLPNVSLADLLSEDSPSVSLSELTEKELSNATLGDLAEDINLSNASLADLLSGDVSSASLSELTDRDLSNATLEDLIGESNSDLPNTSLGDLTESPEQKQKSQAPVLPLDTEKTKPEVSFDALAKEFIVKKELIFGVIYETIVKAGIGLTESEVKMVVDSLGRAVQERVVRGKINLYDEAQVLPLFDALAKLKDQPDKKEDYDRLNDVLKKNGLTEEMIEVFRGDTMMTAADESSLQAYIQGAKKGDVLNMYNTFFVKLERVAKTAEGNYDLTKLSPLELYLLSLSATRMADQTKDEAERAKFEAQIVTDKTAVDKMILAREEFSRLPEDVKKELSRLMKLKENNGVFSSEEQELWDEHKDILETERGDSQIAAEAKNRFEKMTDEEKLTVLVLEANKLGSRITDEESYNIYGEKFAKYISLTQHLAGKMALTNKTEGQPDEEINQKRKEILEQSGIVIPEYVNLKLNKPGNEKFNQDRQKYDEETRRKYSSVDEIVNAEYKSLSENSDQKETEKVKKQRRRVLSAKAKVGLVLSGLIGLGLTGILGGAALSNRPGELPAAQNQPIVDPASIPESPMVYAPKNSAFFQQKPSSTLLFGTQTAPAAKSESSNPWVYLPNVVIQPAETTVSPSGMIEIKVGQEKGASITVGHASHAAFSQADNLKGKTYQLFSLWDSRVSGDFWKALAAANNINLGPEKEPWENFNNIPDGTSLKFTPEVLTAAEAMFK
jgi:hypothetical protein